MADQLSDNLVKLCDNWHLKRDDLTAWEHTADGRLRYKIRLEKNLGLIHPGKTVFLVFKENVNQPQAQKILDPILNKLKESNKDKTCPAFPTAVDLTKVREIVDADKTAQANK